MTEKNLVNEINNLLNECTKEELEEVMSLIDTIMETEAYKKD